MNVMSEDMKSVPFWKAKTNYIFKDRNVDHLYRNIYKSLKKKILYWNLKS